MTRWSGLTTVYCNSNTRQLGDVDNVGYTPHMSRIVRSAMLQMRVSPAIKLASEHVLRRIGLNLTEATELFLRRMIIDQRIPFEVVAFDNAAFTKLMLDWEKERRVLGFKRGRELRKGHQARSRAKRE